MGCAFSKPDILDGIDGDEAAFHARFEEGAVLGEGEFGVVKKVIDTRAAKGSAPLAMKALKKGVTFKDNTLYAPLKPEAIRTECDCLRVLNGEKFNLKLAALFESPSTIYIVTEMCTGGEMLEYLSGTMKGGLRTEDVSRMSYQLLSAVDHCAKHGIIHRDIKPENIMFVNKAKTAELRLIDFGCAAKDADASSDGNSDLVVHKTFAGTPFYIAPEVYAKSYTLKADVWSVGATVYVLVAGYPADCLQQCFNRMQKKYGRDLRKLQNLPDDMPDTYYEMLEGLLAYNHKERKSAGEMLECEFVKFHEDLESDGKSKRPTARRTQSVLFSGTGKRHGAYLNYQKFERAVTTVLATVPSREELANLLKKLDEYKPSAAPMPGIEEEAAPEEDGKENAGKLKVIEVAELKELLMNEGLVDTCSTIESLPNSSDYDGYAYDTTNLRDIAKRSDKVQNASAGTAGTAAATKEGPAPNGGDAEQPATRRGRMSLFVPKDGMASTRRMLPKGAASMRF